MILFPIEDGHKVLNLASMIYFSYPAGQRVCDVHFPGGAWQRISGDDFIRFHELINHPLPPEQRAFRENTDFQ